MQCADSITATGYMGSNCMYTIKIFWFLHLHKHAEHQIRNCCQTVNGRAEKRTMQKRHMMQSTREICWLHYNGNCPALRTVTIAILLSGRI